MIEPFDDSAPGGDEITEYDRTHVKLYLRLLDAETEGADWREAVTVLFGIDPLAEPQRGSSVHASHLHRAHWMTRKGYLDLLRKGRD
ncbi:DNA -binding domain-containing protein [Mesorhizobium sp. UC22_110]|uniref:DNA -binding domain-containing protein n=1 Tax=unclassified Mesorhizobium TaxID=325217 RepID=UPI0036723C64